MNGIATITIHAPFGELRERHDHEHDPGRDGADAVDRSRSAATRGSRRRIHLRTIPVCESVNAVNTPTT